PALAPFLGVGGRNRRLENRAPVEALARILCLERAPDVFVERFPAHLDVGRRSQPVEHALPHFAAAVGDGLNEIEMLVASPVAGEAEERHLPFLLPFWFRGL